MREFERHAVGNVIAMTNDERRAHIEHYRMRVRELQAMSTKFALHAPEAMPMISTDLTSLDRMLALLEDGANERSGR